MTITPASAILDWLRSLDNPRERHLAGRIYYLQGRREKGMQGLITLACYDVPAETKRDDGTVDRTVESWEWTLVTPRCVLWSTNEHRAIDSIGVMRATSARAALLNYYTPEELEGMP